MFTRARMPRFAALWAMPLALWTALPAIQWCPAGWSQVCAQKMIACSAMPDAESKCSGGHCPLMADTPRHERTSSSRAYCLAGPNGGAAEFQRDVRLHAPVLAAGVPVGASVAIPRATAWRTPALQSRPPPGVRQLLPPVRGPPSSMNA